jgi:hypothetical protein
MYDNKRVYFGIDNLTLSVAEERIKLDLSLTRKFVIKR